MQIEECGRVLVTGAGGFIGGRLVDALVRAGVAVSPMFRMPVSADGACQADLLDPASLARACVGIDTVVHCAGYAHAHDVDEGTTRQRHHQVNFVGTRNLLDAAARAGVARFIYLSSVKAMGAPGLRCVDEQWPAPPDTPYGLSKREAEEAVLAAGRCSGMRVCNLRLAMVYGRGSRGNLERMARGIAKGWFPPLPETGHRRSLIHIEDVVSAVRCVMVDARADGVTYIVADAQAWSGAEIYDALRAASGRARATWRVPAPVLAAAGRMGDLLGWLMRRKLPLDSHTVARLIGAECYSPASIYRDLGWQARVTLAQGARELFGRAEAGAAAPAVTGHTCGGGGR
ncbi:MAG: NAD-dependent epimerase/dehydratase family protein [Rhodocyclales bacterium]|nr:NAD-dependent epimerase/dehydratase family protein [Rhodocyclales bacterium]